MPTVTMKPRSVFHAEPRELLLACDDAKLLPFLNHALMRDGVEVTALNLEHAHLRVQRGFSPDLIVLHLSGHGSLSALAGLREA